MLYDDTNDAAAVRSWSVCIQIGGFHGRTLRIDSLRPMTSPFRCGF
jgi:hypothetical protein